MPPMGLEAAIPGLSSSNLISPVAASIVGRPRSLTWLVSYSPRYGPTDALHTTLSISLDLNPYPLKVVAELHLPQCSYEDLLALQLQGMGRPV